jgi:hypothetical protein
MHVEDNGNTWWRRIAEQAMVDKAESMRHSRTKHGPGKGRGLRNVEVVPDQRFDDVIRKFRTSRVNRSSGRAVSVLRDRKTRARLLIRKWDVLDLATPINRDRRRQTVAEDFALVIADDDNSIGSDLN